MSDTFSVKRDGTVWFGADSGTPGKWSWTRIGWVEKDGRKWVAYEADQLGKRYLIAGACPTRHEAVMALRWPEDVPEDYR